MSVSGKRPVKTPYVLLWILVATNPSNKDAMKDTVIYGGDVSEFYSSAIQIKT